MTRNSQTKDLESTLKSLDTEEFIDIHFYRPLGYRWALLFERMGISPNAVTVAGIFIGIAAGICFYYPSPTINVIGMLLLVLRHLCRHLFATHAGLGRMDLANGYRYGSLPRQTGRHGRLLPEHPSPFSERKSRQRVVTLTGRKGEFREDDMET